MTKDRMKEIRDSVPERLHSCIERACLLGDPDIALLMLPQIVNALNNQYEHVRMDDEKPAE